MEEFLNYFDYLVDKSNESLPDNIQEYYNFLRAQKSERPILTDMGAVILDFLQKCADDKKIKAKEIAEKLDVSSRKVSGAMRKLVSDGFADKFGANPVVYSITEKGRNFDITQYKENKNNG